MVLLERIELSASPLPRVRSTTELQQPAMCRRALLSRWRAMSSAGLQAGADSGKAFHMSEGQGNNMSREERLAAKLRENLRRRKAQGREIRNESLGKSRDKELPKGGAEG